MAAKIKTLKAFESKEDLFELMDKFDKSSLFELEISLNDTADDSASEKKIKIKMTKTADANYNLRGAIEYTDDFTGEYEENEEYEEEDKQDVKVIKKSKKNREGSVIKAPLIGTFYAAPSLESEPYVKVGDKITKGTVVCLIEAMKTMNEIESDIDGEIVEISADNAAPVEFGQILFRLK